MLKKFLMALDTKYSDRERKLELMIAYFAPLDVFSSKKEKRQKEKKNRPFTLTSHDINLNTIFL